MNDLRRTTGPDRGHRRGRPGGRPAATSRSYTQRANVAWFCELWSATGAPYKGAHDQPTSPAFQATSPIRGGITTNDIAEGDKPLTTSH